MIRMFTLSSAARMFDGFLVRLFIAALLANGLFYLLFTLLWELVLKNPA